MVDSSDRLRMVVAKDELDMLLQVQSEPHNATVIVMI